MALKKSKHGFIFSSGHEMYANRHIIGLSPKLEVAEGYDGDINWQWILDEEQGEPNSLTKEDLLELADYMLELWAQFKKSVQEH